MSERINIDGLKPGMVILQVTAQNGPVRIRKSGLVTSDAMVTGLREMGVLEIEIDPEQTVEIHDEEAQSQTQFLLQSNSASADAGADASSRQDSQLAEQFNRSLFLPTAQDIPDTWQIYARQFGIAVAVIIVGFGAGFGVAVGPTYVADNRNNDTVSLVENATTTDPTQAEPTQAEPSQEKTLTTNTNDSTNADTLSDEQANGSSALNDPLHATNQAVKGDSAANVDNTAKAERVSSETTGVSTGNSNGTNESSEPEMLVLGLQPKNGESAASLGNDDLSQNPEVSDALLKKFQQVMTEMEEQQKSDSYKPSREPNIPEPKDVPRVDQMPQWILSSLPRLSFNAHMFATEPADRWVKVNGKELGEGDWIDGQLRIQRIDPQHIVMDFQGHEFSMKALSDW